MVKYKEVKNMYHEYPYTTYYNDIDRLCKCCKALQIHLDTHGDYLRLINDKDGSVISAVKISYADTALTDVDGNAIKSYLISAGTNGTHLVFTRGDNEIISFEVPYAVTAAKDVQEKDILDYVYNVSISGNKVRITNGDGTVYELTIPFATAAAETVDGYDLRMLACSLITDGNDLVLKDTRDRELSRITPNFALKAKQDVDGDDIKSTYATSMYQTDTKIRLLAKDGTVLSEETINYAVTALKDTDGNLFLSDYAEKMVIDLDGKRIGLEAHDGTRLATITVPFATLANDANNAIENVQVIGDQIVFTTYNGQTFSITAPYAVKAQKDDNNNTIKTTYFAGVDNDTDAGIITFYDALGNVLATIQNGVITHAIYDDYDNKISDYIKEITANAGSDYVAITHGDGTVNSIVVDYANRAWKDTNNNVIKNTYVKRLAIAQDPDDNQWKLFAFNGDNPEALLFALVIVAEKAYKDVNGKLLTSYLANAYLDSTDELVTQDGENNEVNRIYLPYGKSLVLDNSNLKLLDSHGNALSSIPIPHVMQVYVDVNNGNDTNDGSSYANAVKTIAKAFKLARDLNVQIYVKTTGAYTETVNTLITPDNQAFVVKDRAVEIINENNKVINIESHYIHLMNAKFYAPNIGFKTDYGFSITNSELSMGKFKTTHPDTAFNDINNSIVSFKEYEVIGAQGHHSGGTVVINSKLHIDGNYKNVTEFFNCRTSDMFIMGNVTSGQIEVVGGSFAAPYVSPGTVVGRMGASIYPPSN
jgi:hypothetical protein